MSKRTFFHLEKTTLEEFPWYAILISLYPSLALLAHNIVQVDVRVAYRSAFLSVFVTLILVFALTGLLKDSKKAGITVSLFLILFFSYGHVYNYIRKLEVVGLLLGRHRFLLLVWVFILFLCAGLILRKSRIDKTTTSVLMLISMTLVAFPVFQLGRHAFYQWRAKEQVNPQSVVSRGYIPDVRPDVYFIILDMYGRSDILLEEFDYDDSAFLDKLQELGFFVAQCSRSNYPTTEASLAATLNMNYLPNISDELSSSTGSVSILHRVLVNNAVFKTFEELGYQTFAFETGYVWAELKSADTFYVYQSQEINSFEELLIRSSLLLAFDDFGFLDDFHLTGNKQKHEAVTFSFEKLRAIPEMPGPKFVVAHLMVPHPPFVFGPEGSLNAVPPRYSEGEDYYPKEDFKLGVQNQVAFIEKIIPDIVQDILKKSDKQPIIIIQGDHGFKMVSSEEQSVANLSAYYFPEPQPELYHSLTPVNNFRLIFRTYFDADLPNIPDKSFFWGETSFGFVEIENNNCVPSQ